jgi:DNA polymerase-3 subunit epsilon
MIEQMKVIYLDTETTGLTNAEICQLSYITDNGIEVYGTNYFFKVFNMNPHAQAVHGYSLEMLDELSSGKTFDEHIDAIERDFSDAMIVAHNAAFDIMMLKAEFVRRGRVFNPERYLCTMRFMTPYLKLNKSSGCGYKYPRLHELVAAYLNDYTAINDLVYELFGVRSAFHDARFDAASLYLAVHSASGVIDKLKEAVCV